jgi:phosphohistidine phosphatase
MHRLHLLRHAKSAWDEGIEDSRRPLSKRGRQSAQLIGETLPKAIGALDLVLSSTALRTRETAELVLAGYAPAPCLIFEDDLYLATVEELLARLRRLDDGCAAVLLIGHNPGLHELAATLAASGSKGAVAIADGKFPTGVRVSFMIEGNWAALNAARHKVTDYVTVKSLGGSE